jgi:BirA family biotin operon repressor/biotin-[acetyl-CoA-carboxylase] ligase
MAGVAAVRAIGGIGLKWPNDLLLDGFKVGGILVEASEGLAVVGLGLTLWWPEPPDGAAGLYVDDPGPERHAEVGALWAAELMRIVDEPGWPRDEYLAHSVTLGHDITWEPGGSGRAVDVADDGGLVVETESGTETIYSGAVRHVR